MDRAQAAAPPERRWRLFRPRRPVRPRDPFFFSIPLRPRGDPTTWPVTERMLGETLRSILAQDDPDFGVIVVGHDRPDVAELGDPRITFLPAEIERPADPHACQIDQIIKRRIAAAEIGRRGGGYLMVVDADDLVHHGIVSFVRSDRHPVGYMVRAGYVLDSAAGRLGLLPDRQRVQQLWANCGTCAILRFTADELPRMAKDRVDYERSHSLYEKLVGHRLWETALMLHDRYPASLPFRGVIYRMNSGDNLSYSLRKPKLIDELLRATTESPVDIAVKRMWFDGAPVAAGVQDAETSS